MSDTNNSVPLQLFMTEWQASRLWEMAGESAYAEQSERFEDYPNSHFHHPSHPVFERGTMYWCVGPAEATLLCSYEDAAGYTVTLLTDSAFLAQGGPHHVVLSSRHYRPTTD